MFDVIVIGVGGHGSSSIYHLAKSGLNVLGIEQFEQIHENIFKVKLHLDLF